ncbi:MAG TPA: nicotinate-nucleotide--dimethylbenzimidazole phosphoribosyltransferase [Kofleriaceae bacterium]|nr:nicotinate-nucleotide--dimethylbenzimidazole phosphoribosyltransferase [Kofleriaceae bacterium]
MTHPTLAATLAEIREPDRHVAEHVQRLLDAKTKPRRSLGRLEDLASQVAAIRGTPAPGPLAKAIVVMAADHGVAAEAVSAYPQEVTRQMLRNFARGGAAINVLARQAGARLVVVDMGVAVALPDEPALRAHRIAAGTANLAHGPAMTRAQALAAIEAGIAIARELADDGIGVLGLGEMGIANTTAASALTAALTGAEPEAVTGRGTGIDDAAIARKRQVVRAAIARSRPDPGDPLGVLAALGGFEIAGLVGVTLGGAAAGIPVVVDGFISGAAALVATRLAPAVAGALVCAHRSVEIGHRHVLAALGREPLLDLELRLGEGTGAALAMPLIDAALAILADMASFSEAGVTDRGA